tara:strand:- start:4113 stop:5381 length:1269 start_codon:yes stop_codon:yes gene_type:complete
MANGPRLKRQGGFKSSSGLDNLMQVLQMGSGIAQSVQQNRDRKFTYFKSFVDTLLGDMKGEKNSDILNEKLEHLEDYYGKRANKNHYDTIEYMKMAKNAIGNEIRKNDDYKLRLDAWENQSEIVDDFVNEQFLYGQLDKIGQEKVRREDSGFNDWKVENPAKLIGDLLQDDHERYVDYQTFTMKGHMDTFGDFMTNFAGKHGERIPDVVWNDIKDTKSYMANILNDYKFDGIMDEVEHSAYWKRTQYGDSDDLAMLRTTKDQARIETTRNNRLELKGKIDEYNRLKGLIDTKDGGTGEELMKAEEMFAYVGVGQDFVDFEAQDYYMLDLAGAIDEDWGDAGASVQQQAAYKLRNQYINKMQKLEEDIKGLNTNLERSSIHDSLKDFEFWSPVGEVEDEVNFENLSDDEFDKLWQEYEGQINK